jgi:phosphohistidine phosphatase
MSLNKVLHIVRHAKSSWDLEDVSDADRPLIDKGVWKAYQVAEKIRKDYPVPDLLISSHAIRALHTAVIFAGVMGVPFNRLNINAQLYNQSADDIFHLIRTTSDDVRSLIIFGHNPDFTDIVNKFASKPIKNLPTAGAVTFEFKAPSWKDIDAGEVISQVNHFTGKQ